MLPAPGFPYAAQRIQPGQSAQAVMGPYYPQAVYCAKATFEQGGWRACFAAARVAVPAAPARAPRHRARGHRTRRHHARPPHARAHRRHR